MYLIGGEQEEQDIIKCNLEIDNKKIPVNIINVELQSYDNDICGIGGGLIDVMVGKKINISAEITDVNLDIIKIFLKLTEQNTVSKYF